MHEITSLSEFNEILLNNKRVVVDFFADWCGPCKKIAPYFVDLSTDYKNVYFCKVNVDIGEEIASLCEVSSLPTFLFYKNKENVDELIGANQTDLLNKVESLNQ